MDTHFRYLVFFIVMLSLYDVSGGDVMCELPLDVEDTPLDFSACTHVVYTPVSHPEADSGRNDSDAQTGNSSTSSPTRESLFSRVQKLKSRYPEMLVLVQLVLNKSGLETDFNSDFQKIKPYFRNLDGIVLECYGLHEKKVSKRIKKLGRYSQTKGKLLFILPRHETEYLTRKRPGYYYRINSTIDGVIIKSDRVTFSPSERIIRGVESMTGMGGSSVSLIEQIRLWIKRGFDVNRLVIRIPLEHPSNLLYWTQTPHFGGEFDAVNTVHPCAPLPNLKWETLEAEAVSHAQNESCFLVMNNHDGVFMKAREMKRLGLKGVILPIAVDDGSAHSGCVEKIQNLTLAAQRGLNTHNFTSPYHPGRIEALRSLIEEIDFM